MYRVFISQPMRGRTIEDIYSERDSIENYLRTYRLNHDFVVIPMLSEAECRRNTPVHCLGRSIQDISMADLIVFAKGWEDARGCRIEHEVCVEYDKTFIHMSEEGDR